MLRQPTLARLARRSKAPEWVHGPGRRPRGEPASEQAHGRGRRPRGRPQQSVRGALGWRPRGRPTVDRRRSVLASWGGDCAGSRRTSLPCFGFWRWKMNMTSGAHLAARRVAGPSRRRGRREEQARSRKDISHAFADYVPACYTTWSATSAKVIKMKDPRNKNTKYISVILIVIIERVTYNGKDVKTPLTGRRTPPHAVFYSSALGFPTAHADAERASSPLLSPR